MSNKRLTEVWEKSTHKSTHLLALLSLADRADDDGHCWPSQKDTASRARSTRSYINQVMEDLEVSGEIYALHRPGTTHRYLVIVGMTDDEIRSAMIKRFGFTEIDAAAQVEKVRCLQNEHVRKTNTRVSVKRTPPVRPTDTNPKEPSIEPKDLKEWGADAPPPPEPPKPKSSKSRDERLDHPAMKAYNEIMHLWPPNNEWRDRVCEVNDIGRWREILLAWSGKGHRPDNVAGLLDVYRQGWTNGKSNTNGNGHKSTTAHDPAAYAAEQAAKRTAAQAVLKGQP